MMGTMGRRSLELLDLLVGMYTRWRQWRSWRIGATWPWVTLCTIVLIVCVASLLGIAYCVGRKPPAPSADFGSAVVVTLAKPGVALGCGAVLVLILGACLRRIRFDRLAALPGPIRARDLSA